MHSRRRKACRDRLGSRTAPRICRLGGARCLAGEQQRRARRTIALQEKHTIVEPGTSRIAEPGTSRIAVERKKVAADGSHHRRNVAAGERAYIVSDKKKNIIYLFIGRVVVIYASS